MKDHLDFEAPINEMLKLLDKFKELQAHGKGEYLLQISELEEKIKQKRIDLYQNLTPWQIVQIARHPARPVLQDFIGLLFTDFIELHGDRCFADDRALIGGFARFADKPFMVIGHNKGKNVTENIDRNFGQPKPEGYRKAIRLMHLAEKYNVPIITFIDTQGAFPGSDAEERGQAEAIARSITDMAQIKVPIITIVTGEGGSGGALAIGVADYLAMLSNAYYSVITPEGCASILWRDAIFAQKAAEAMKITASDLKALDIIDEIIPEPAGGAHVDYNATSVAIASTIEKALKPLVSHSATKLVNKRFEKFSKMGKFTK